MLGEFCRLTGAEESVFHQNWLKYESTIFKYAPLEQKKAVKKLVSQYLKGDRDNAGTCYVLNVSTHFQVIFSTDRTTYCLCTSAIE